MRAVEEVVDCAAEKRGGEGPAELGDGFGLEEGFVDTQFVFI